MKNKLYSTVIVILVCSNIATGLYVKYKPIEIKTVTKFEKIEIPKVKIKKYKEAKETIIKYETVFKNNPIIKIEDKEKIKVLETEVIKLRKVVKMADEIINELKETNEVTNVRLNLVLKERDNMFQNNLQLQAKLKLANSIKKHTLSARLGDILITGSISGVVFYTAGRLSR